MAINVLHDILNRRFSGSAEQPRRKINAKADANPATTDAKAAQKPAAARTEGKRQRGRGTKPPLKSGGRRGGVGRRVAPVSQLAILKRPEGPGAPRKATGEERKELEEVYAGSGFSNSPAPCSLPLPSFSTTKKEMEAVVDQLATIGLRRMLRLA